MNLRVPTANGLWSLWFILTDIIVLIMTAILTIIIYVYSY